MLHFVMFHYIALHHIPFQYITFHSNTLHSIPIHDIPFQYITFHSIPIHYITSHYITLQYITYIQTYKYIHTVSHIELLTNKAKQKCKTQCSPGPLKSWCFWHESQQHSILRHPQLSWCLVWPSPNPNKEQQPTST